MKSGTLALLGTTCFTLSPGMVINAVSAATIDITPQETLVMATSADFPPFEFLETINGVEEIVGFDIDVAKFIAGQINMPLDILNRSFPTLLPSLADNEFDFVIAALNATPERLEIIDVSDPYYEETIAFVSRKSDFVTDPPQLINSKLGVQTGSSGVNIATELQNTVSGLEIVTFDQQDQIIAAILSGEVKAGLTVDVVAEFFVENNPTLDFTPVPSLGGFEAVIAFPKGSPNVEPFNLVIAEMRETGVLADLERKWFGAASTQPVPEPSAFLGLITLGTLFFSTSLKNKI